MVHRHFPGPSRSTCLITTPNGNHSPPKFSSDRGYKDLMQLQNKTGQNEVPELRRLCSQTTAYDGHRLLHPITQCASASVKIRQIVQTCTVGWLVYGLKLFKFVCGICRYNSGVSAENDPLLIHTSVTSMNKRGTCFNFILLMLTV